MIYFARVYKTGEKVEKTVEALIGRGRSPQGWNVYEEWKDGELHYIGYISHLALRRGQTKFRFPFKYEEIYGVRVIELQLVKG